MTEVSTEATEGSGVPPRPSNIVESDPAAVHFVQASGQAGSRVRFAQHPRGDGPTGPTR
jgi:hypothetical protein